MASEKRYLHDRFVLLLLSIGMFLTFGGSVLILLRLNETRANTYIVQYRANLGVSAYSPGRLADMLGFVVFLFLILILHTIISRRLYQSQRVFALWVLGLSILLLVLDIIVSNALLVLR